MKLIIDISEDTYKRHKWRVNSDMCTELDIAVAKGIPLDDIKAEINQICEDTGYQRIHKNDVFKIIYKRKEENNGNT